MIALLIGLQIVLPLVLIAWLAIAPSHNLLGVSLQALVTALTLFAIARMGVWVFPPWWTPYIYALLFTITLVTVFRQHKPRRKLPSSWLGWIAIIGFVAFGVFVGNEAVQSWAGQFPPPIPAVNLAFPLRGGDYLILNGGSDIRINAHLKTMDESVARFRAYRGQSYGIDIIQIDRFGLRTQGVVPSDPVAYQIYGEPVLAPCAGKIVQAIDDLPDMTIPQIDRVNRAGNHVILRCGDIDVLLAHFRPQSLSVQTGTDVKVGDRIAEVGNSGASDEPHLHIHAQRPGSSVAPFSGDPLPMRFNGRFLIRSDRPIMPKKIQQVYQSLHYKKR
ncbi:M23 family metallopeptidase [Halotia branconii]|uniref:M23 family metallopeptidase n=1 Tax=Halotia branconii CENA392 TaxID=1539056 RepID=A0AAJ6NS91_9CYAN|nr:M23 family metallopeptidase [Halotia branconii]WGV25655.1 M23 family metallopeptidase [Halotia branconii CENA392]